MYREGKIDNIFVSDLEKKEKQRLKQLVRQKLGVGQDDSLRFFIVEYAFIEKSKRLAKKIIVNNNGKTIEFGFFKLYKLFVNPETDKVLINKQTYIQLVARIFEVSEDKVKQEQSIIELEEKKPKDKKIKLQLRLKENRFDLSCLDLSNLSLIEFGLGDLTNVNLSDSNLTNVDFRQIRISRSTNFTRAKLFGAIFSKIQKKLLTPEIQNYLTEQIDNKTGETIYVFSLNKIKEKFKNRKVEGGFVRTLRQINLSGLDLSKLNFNSTDFTETDLSNSNLKESRFESAFFIKTRLINADLRGCSYVTATNFYQTPLEGAKFDSKYFKDKKHSKYTLPEWIENGLEKNPDEADTYIFRQDTLIQAIVDGKIDNLRKVYLKFFQLKEIDEQLIEVDFSDSRLINFSFFGTDLSQTKFVNADLNNGNFRYTNLSATDFSNSTLINIDFRQAQITTQTNFDQAKLDNCYFSARHIPYLPEHIKLGLKPAKDKKYFIFKREYLLQTIKQRQNEELDLTNANLDGFDLSNLNLSKFNLSGASLWQTKLHNTIIGSNFSKKTMFICADLRGADLKISDLKQGRKRNLKDELYLSVEEQSYLIKKIVKGNKKAIGILVENYVDLVGYIINRLKTKNNYSDNEDDLKQTAYLFLITVIRKLDYIFNSINIYRYYLINGVEIRLKNYLSYKTNFIKLSKDLQKLIGKYYTIKRDLEKKLARKPSQEEIEQACLDFGFTEEDINKIQQVQNLTNTRSLDEPIFDDKEKTSLYDLLGIEAGIEKEIEKKELSKYIKEKLSQLSDKERMVVEMYFGLNGESTYTFKEIGEKIGVTRERVGQIMQKIIDKLRKRIKWD